jgi:hypothetical protein
VALHITIRASCLAPEVSPTCLLTRLTSQTLPILPHLLPILTALDPNVPTYIGTSLGRWKGYPEYFEGMMYGFNWGVVSPLYRLIHSFGQATGIGMEWRMSGTVLDPCDTIGALVADAGGQRRSRSS